LWQYREREEWKGISMKNQLLVIGYWLLVIGYWLLVIGYWLFGYLVKR
jgi:hypothetical protein